METTTLHLHKQNFKFSSAHFLIFDKQTAERLHGHNYQVKVDIAVPSEKELSKLGYFVDFNVFKKKIKAKLDEWDEMVLLPNDHEDMNFKENGPSLEVRFRDRFYVFPKNEVLRLPVSNTSVEQLSQLLAQSFIQEFKSLGVQKIQVSVEETRGQAASTIAVL
jgi:6-pyruvoyltetrahydropterin/6-carboxytetrahydropterin synthase